MRAEAIRLAEQIEAPVVVDPVARRRLGRRLTGFEEIVPAAPEPADEVAAAA